MRPYKLLDVLIGMADALRTRTDGQLEADVDRINLALVNITEEEIAARNALQAAITTKKGYVISTARALS